MVKKSKLAGGMNMKFVRSGEIYFASNPANKIILLTRC